LTKEVIISVKGFQLDPAEKENPIETINQGLYYQKENTHYFLYEETREDLLSTKSMIKINEEELTITKKGFLTTHMVFQENKSNTCSYHTPYGEIVFEIATKKIQFELSENKMQIQVAYTLKSQGETLLDGNVTIFILPHTK
jgi:uncharacterized beta-barrel protein YwiB (DUF1934 family)